MERAEGIEPPWPAWKAGALPLSYARDLSVWKSGWLFLYIERRAKQFSQIIGSTPSDRGSRWVLLGRAGLFSGLIIRIYRYGGWGGIRTRGTFRYTRFPGVPNRPLWHPSCRSLDFGFGRVRLQMKLLNLRFRELAGFDRLDSVAVFWPVLCLVAWAVSLLNLFRRHEFLGRITATLLII